MYIYIHIIIIKYTSVFFDIFAIWSGKYPGIFICGVPSYVQVQRSAWYVNVQIQRSA